MVLHGWAAAFAHPESPASLFAEANSRYQEGDFAAAERTYRRLLDSGVQSGSVYFNLGNACFKQERLGEAIYYWEKAAQWMPGDTDVMENLEFARLLLVDRIEIPDDPYPVKLLKQAAHTLTVSQESWILLILFVSANLAFGTYILARTPGLALRSFAASVVLGVVLLLVGSSLAWKVYERNHRREGVVVEQRVDIRSGPSPDYITVVSVHEGIKVRIRGEAEDWYQVILPNGWSGWLPKDALGVL